jgi:phosphoserine phosphatase
MMSPTRLHVFDMDGTLLPGTTASVELSRGWGVAAGLAELERAFAAGGLDPVGFAEQVLRLWAGMDQEHVVATFRAAPKLAGIRSVLADIRRRGEMSAVVTLSPDCFARLFRGFGAHFVIASRFPAPPFRTPLVAAGILSSERKVEAVDTLCRRLNIGWRHVVAYGDGPTDLPMFRRAGCAVAVGAGPSTVAEADVSYPGRDLREAYRLARRAMARRTRPAHRWRTARWAY